MWKDNEKAPVWEYLGWVLLISAVSEIIILLLEPYSIAFAKNGTLTAGYVFYAITGILFTTPNPMIAIYIVLKRHKKIRSVKDFFKLILHTADIIKTFLITAAFCAAVLCAAIIYGTRTSSPWYVMIIAFPVMIIGGGVEEIGWRGFLQPALEKKFPFPIATFMVSAIWFSWHLPLWIEPSSNHYGDSLAGFAITITVWAFVGASIYKATKSVIACVTYHTFMNSIGAIYNWNALFDTFPNKSGMIVYYCIALIAAVIIWLLADRKEKRALRKEYINEEIHVSEV
ncbi:MAG: type II CAAX endopeptidase family protein [Bacillota bacterium]|nr:type II CAAX endopeptidase family protein [Bacillota bacterium]